MDIGAGFAIGLACGSGFFASGLASGTASARQRLREEIELHFAERELTIRDQSGQRVLLDSVLSEVIDAGTTCSPGKKWILLTAVGLTLGLVLLTVVLVYINTS